MDRLAATVLLALAVLGAVVAWWAARPGVRTASAPAAAPAIDARPSHERAELAPGRRAVEGGRALAPAPDAPPASAAPEALSAASAPLALLSGRVVDEHGAPLAGARVSARSTGIDWLPRTTSSDATGRFELEVALVDVLVQASATGRVPWERFFAGERPAEVEIVLERTLTLRVRVLSAASGRPLERFAVHAERVAPGELGEVLATPRLATLRGAAPNSQRREDGRATIADLSAGRYRVAVQAPGHAPSLGEPIELRHDRAQPPEIVFALERGLAAAGVIERCTGEPAPTANVRLWRLAPQQELLASLAAVGGGRFRFADLPPGNYVISATLRDAGASNPFEIELRDASLEDLRIVLPPSARLTGRVIDAEIAGGAAQVLLYRRDGTLRHVQADPDGSYVFDDLGAGDYLLRAMPKDCRELVMRWALELNGFRRSTAPGDLVLAPGESARRDLWIERPGRGSLEGSLRINGAPAAGFLLTVAHPEAGVAERTRVLELGPDGTFTIDDLLAGDLVVELSAPGSPLVLARERIAVRRGGRAFLHRDLSTAALTIVLLGDGGAPLEGEARAGRAGILNRATPGSFEPARFAVRAGALTIEHMPAGPIDLDLVLDGREPERFQLDLVAGEHHHLELVPPPAAGR